jgi:hypothetical protein
MFLSCALLGAALSIGAIAPVEVKGKAQSADSIAAFWEKFKAAVIKGDKETVAALSRFPISRSYGMTDLKNKAQLMRHYRELFFGETNAAKCFPKAKPEVSPGTKNRPKEFTISCSFAGDGGAGDEPFEYRFTLTRNGWRFTSFTNINE